MSIFLVLTVESFVCAHVEVNMILAPVLFALRNSSRFILLQPFQHQYNQLSEHQVDAASFHNKCFHLPSLPFIDKNSLLELMKVK